MEHIKELLSAYIDHGLPETESQRVEAHLARCAECRIELEELRAASRLVASLPRKPLPAGFLESLERRRRSEWELPFWYQAIHAWTASSWARPAAAVFCAITVMVVVFNRRDQLPFSKSAPSSGALGVREGYIAQEAPMPSVPRSPTPLTETEELKPAKKAGLSGRKLKEIANIGAASVSGKSDEFSRAASLSAGAPPRDVRFGKFEEPVRSKQSTGVSGALKTVPVPAVSGPNKPGAQALRQIMKASGGGEYPLSRTDPKISDNISSAETPEADDSKGLALKKRSPGSPRTFVFRDGASLRDFWTARGLQEPPPVPDFPREMLVLVLGASSDTRAKIVGVDKKGDRIVVRCRMASPLPDRNKASATDSIAASRELDRPERRSSGWAHPEAIPLYDYKILSYSESPVQLELVP